jgi:Zn/Cd-binding protein ZinT
LFETQNLAPNKEKNRIGGKYLFEIRVKVRNRNQNYGLSFSDHGLSPNILKNPHWGSPLCAKTP